MLTPLANVDNTAGNMSVLTCLLLSSGIVRPSKYSCRVQEEKCTHISVNILKYHCGCVSFQYGHYPATVTYFVCLWLYCMPQQDLVMPSSSSLP